MDEKEISLHVQLMAIEHLLTKQIALRYLASGYSIELVQSMHKLQIEQARQETFPTAQPVLSDHVAAEYETELQRLLRAVEDHLAAAKAR